MKGGQIESYKQQLDAQADSNRWSISELLKMKDQVLQLLGAKGEEEEHQPAWTPRGENPSEDQPHAGEEDAQTESRANE